MQHVDQHEVGQVPPRDLQRIDVGPPRHAACAATPEPVVVEIQQNRIVELIADVSHAPLDCPA
ncbi:MAG: hypothetical protein ACREE7_04060 [Dongiaceae bacterium]